MLFNPLPRQIPYCTKNDFLMFINMYLKNQLIEGKYIKNFEEQFAKQYGVNFALALGSCRSGFALIVDALEIKKGDEVILPAFNLCAFPKILKFKGIKPVFVDIHEETFNIDVNKIEENITAQTKAIVAVHLFGNTCDMDKIMTIAKKHNLFVIEDCANAFMAKYKNKNVGTYGDVACFSLGHSKDVPTFGGGIVITNYRAMYSKMMERYDREYIAPKVGNLIGVFVKNLILKITTSKIVFFLFVYPIVLLFSLFGFDIVGHFIEDDEQMITEISKSRFTNFQARVGINKLSENNHMQIQRVDIARKFNAVLSSLKGVTVTKHIEGGGHAYWNYPILFNKREYLIKNLIHHGIDARGVTTYNCNCYKIFEEFRRECPSTDRISRMILTLPIYHTMSDKDVSTINRVMEQASDRLL